MLFEDLGKKISKAGEEAVQKTKEVADAVKLNSQIAEEERRLRSLYQTIGETYYKECAGQAPETFRELFCEVAAVKQRVDGFQQALDTLKGIKTCRSCGEKIPEKAAFCPQCGKAAPVEETEASAADTTNGTNVCP